MVAAAALRFGWMKIAAVGVGFSWGPSRGYHRLDTSRESGATIWRRMKEFFLRIADPLIETVSLLCSTGSPVYAFHMKFMLAPRKYLHAVVSAIGELANHALIGRIQQRRIWSQNICYKRKRQRKS